MRILKCGKVLLVSGLALLVAVVVFFYCFTNRIKVSDVKSSRTSIYVAAHDGTKLAVDIFYPRNAMGKKFPALIAQTCYGRSHWDGSSIIDYRAKYSWVQELVSRGYVVVVADVRGTGASYGSWSGPFSSQECTDFADLCDWVVAQSWSNGWLGAFGRSYNASSALSGALQTKLPLKALFLEMGMYDLYEFAHPGGAIRKGCIEDWNELRIRLDKNLRTSRVDEDLASGKMLRSAISEHSKNYYPKTESVQFSDGIDEVLRERIYEERSPWNRMSRLPNFTIPVYYLTGWRDPWVRDAFLCFTASKGSKCIAVGPWSHDEVPNFSYVSELTGWFESGGASRKGIQYYTFNSKEPWAHTDVWPPVGVFERAYYLSAAKSLADERLAENLATSQLSDVYKADPNTTSGRMSRWYAITGKKCCYGDLRGNDEIALCYTTPSLKNATCITGSPVARLKMKIPVTEADVVLMLEDVDEEGSSTYVTEGCLRISHRNIMPSGYSADGIVFHDHTFSGRAGLSRDPIELQFDMLPISWVFRRGHRIRLAIMFYDKDNLKAVSDESFSVEVLRGDNSSCVVLPINPNVR